MATILGLDLGSNSIGWAFVDTTDNKITAAGVRVFAEGVDNPGGAQEESKNAARRAARLTRRGYKRKLMKRSRLITLLRKSNMFPNRSECIPDYYMMNPYELRRTGLYEELTPCQFFVESCSILTNGGGSCQTGKPIQKTTLKSSRDMKTRSA